MTEANAPLLDYAIISEPFPLYATTGTDDPATALHIVVSNGGGDTVHCREIIFSLPEGQLAQSLVTDDAGDGVAPDWTVTRLEPGARTAQPPGDYADFHAKPKQGDCRIDVSGLVITLTNLKISPLPGTAHIEIREFATTNTDHWPDNPAFTRLALTKFPAPHTPTAAVSDFTATPLEVKAGESVSLTWNGPSTLAYAVSHGDKNEPVSNGHEYSTTVDRDTTFQLSYVVGETTHCLTTTVTVKNPKLEGLTAQDVTVTGTLGVGGRLTADNAKIGWLDLPAGIQSFAIGEAQDRQPKNSYTAETDGVLCGHIYSGNSNIQEWVNVRIGGEEKAVASACSSSSIHHNFFALPIRQGVTYLPDHGLMEGSWGWSTFFWIPLAETTPDLS